MADQFEANHGHLVRQEHADCKTAYKLGKALEQRRPPIRMTQGVIECEATVHAQNTYVWQ